MHQQSIQRTLAAAAVLAVMLSGCGASSSTAPSATPTATASPSAAPMAQADGTRLGLGVKVSLSSKETQGEIRTTAAGVMLDEEGKILRCVIDEAENTLSIQADGKPGLPDAAKTKWELGDDYNMKQASSIGKEWYEQCQAFCDYIQGMTAEEVAELETDDGYAAQPDLMAGCTIRISNFVQAVEKAAREADVQGATAADTLSLGAVSDTSGKDASADQDGQLQATTTFVLMTKDGEGRVTSAIADAAEPAFTYNTAGELLTDADTLTSKREKKDAYGMKKASAIGKEWYEQSDAFCAYLTGKTASEIRAIPSAGTDTDLAAVCTISVSEFLQAAVKAAET